VTTHDDVSKDHGGLGGEAVARPIRLGSGSARSLATQVIGLATSFVVGVVAARTLGVAGKGALSVVMQTAGLLVVLLDFGITTSMIYLMSRGELRAGTAAANSTLLAVAVGVVATPIVYLLLVGRLAVMPGIPVLAVAAAVLLVPASVLAAGLGGVSLGLGDMVLPLRSAIASSVTALVILAGLALTGRADVGTVAAASAAGTAVGVMVFVVGLRRRATPFRPDLRAAMAAVPFSAKVHLSNVAGFLLERQDILLLGWIAGARAVGLYAVGVSLAEFTWYVPSALGVAIMTRSAQTSEDSGVDYVARSTRAAIILMSVTVAATLLLAPLGIPFIYGRAFAPAVYSCFVLLPGIIVDGVTRILWSYQTVRGRVYWRQALGATLLNVVLVVLLVPRLGPVGAALASSAAYGAVGVYVIMRFCRDTGATPGQVLIPRWEDVRVIGRTLRELAGSRQESAAPRP
jgi:O-antigen/teichoic acid export membrane protein